MNKLNKNELIQLTRQILEDLYDLEREINYTKTHYESMDLDAPSIDDQLGKLKHAIENTEVVCSVLKKELGL